MRARIPGLMPRCIRAVLSRAGALVVLFLLFSPVSGELPSTDPARAEVDLSGLLTRLEREAATLEDRAVALETLHDTHVSPLVDLLLRRTQADSLTAVRLSVSLMREARSVDLDPRLLLAVMLVENPWLDPRARSPVGAIGLMQVMPFHAGGWGCPDEDLTDVDANICHGARILAAAVDRSGGDLDTALLRYNGCVNGTNTPDCHSYPTWVYGEAGAEWTTEILNGVATS